LVLQNYTCPSFSEQEKQILSYLNYSFYNFIPQEEMMRGKPGYEHLNEPLHILVEAELPVEIIDARLMQARDILEDLLKPVVTTVLSLFCTIWLQAFCFLDFSFSS
jgi:hypothetical protein